MVSNRLILSVFLVVGVYSLSSCQSIFKKLKTNTSTVTPISKHDKQSEVSPRSISLLKEVSVNPYNNISPNMVGSNSNNPFEIVNEIAKKELRVWLNRITEVPAFSGKRPGKPKLPAPTLLKKSEFETTQAFQNKVLIKEQERLNIINALEKEYQDDIDSYNNKVRNHNQATINEKKHRENVSEKKYWDFVNNSLSSVLGEPNVTIDRYNADDQVFYAVLGSNKSNLEQWIKVFVPNNRAKIFKRNAGSATPILSFERNINEKLIISTVSIEVGATEYEASLINKPIFNTQEHVIRSKEITTPGNYLSIN